MPYNPKTNEFANMVARWTKRSQKAFKKALEWKKRANDARQSGTIIGKIKAKYYDMLVAIMRKLAAMAADTALKLKRCGRKIANEENEAENVMKDVEEAQQKMKQQFKVGANQQQKEEVKQTIKEAKNKHGFLQKAANKTKSIAKIINNRAHQIWTDGLKQVVKTKDQMQQAIKSKIKSIKPAKAEKFIDAAKASKAEIKEALRTGRGIKL